jgi:hypothetical protein
VLNDRHIHFLTTLYNLSGLYVRQAKKIPEPDYLKFPAQEAGLSPMIHQVMLFIQDHLPGEAKFDDRGIIRFDRTAGVFDALVTLMRVYIFRNQSLKQDVDMQWDDLELFVNMLYSMACMSLLTQSEYDLCVLTASSMV